jgi:hypothetical protein
MATPAYCLIDAEDSGEIRIYPALFAAFGTVSQLKNNYAQYKKTQFLVNYPTLSSDYNNSL